MSATNRSQTHETHLGRRRFIQFTAAGAATAAGIGSQTDEADALAPVAIGLGAAVLGAGIAGFALGEWDPLESDSPPKGLTPGAFKTRSYQIALTRQSTNASDIVDNSNLLQASDDDAYADGKIDGIEALNDQVSESEVVTASHEAVNVRQATIQGNLLKGWRESVNEFESLLQTARDHGDISVPDVFDVNGTGTSTDHTFSIDQTTVQLADGSSIDVPRIRVEGGHGSNAARYTPANFEDVGSAGTSSPVSVVVKGDSETVEYLDFAEWNAAWQEIETVHQEVRDGLSNWVSKVYDEVQAGELNPDDLMSPSEIAKTMPDGEGYPQAMADLLALNLPTDLEREAEIYIPEIDGTLYGSLQVTEVPESGISAGDSIEPTTVAADYYLTYDVSEGHGIWSDYQTGVDGGTITFGSKPYQETVYAITTEAGETVEVNAEDFSETEEGGQWTYDASDDLEKQITEVVEVTFYAPEGDTRYETVQLTTPFDVVSITNTETGDEVDSMNFTQSTPQTDDNYITEEEWQQLQERNQELIEKYENSKDDGGFFGGVSMPGSGLLSGTSGLAFGGSLLSIGIAGAVGYFISRD